MTDNLIFETEREVSSAFIDSSVRMGVAQSVLLVQDNLTECFGAMGCDGVVYREKFNAFWVFTKTKVHFFRRPDWREIVTARTFSIDNLGMRTHVNTEIVDKAGRQLLVANQEACVLSLENHRPMKLTALPYPKEGFPPAVFNEPFERFPADFSENELAFEQVIRSCHIDMSRHMNNIEYIKFALSVFDDDFLQSHEVTDLEVHYTGESKEGQTLRVFRRDAPDGCDEGEGAAAPGAGCAEVNRAGGTGATGKTFVHIKEGERCVFECCIKFVL